MGENIVIALVTGVAGFIGHHLASELIRSGVEVIGVDSFTDYYDTQIKRENLASVQTLGGSFEFLEGDLRTMDLVALLARVDHVYHQAGQPGVRKSWGDEFVDYLGLNVEVTQKLLEAAKSSTRLQRFVYASSSSIYGNAERYPTFETDLPQPHSPYGVTKLAAEHLCSLYASNFGVPTVALRYFTVYGPGQRPDMAFTRFTKAAVSEETITIFGDGEQVRDFTYVGDIVRANIAAANGAAAPGTVFNVAGGTNASVNEVLALIEEFLGRPLNVEYQETALGDVRRTGADTELIRTTLGWSAEVTLREGLKRQFDWARDRWAPVSLDNGELV